MGRHGIARNYEHAVVERSADRSSVTFELRDSAETRAAYPYSFKLNMTYAITGEATLSQTFHVTNTGDVTLPFCVGGHPAFNMPMGDAVDEGVRGLRAQVRPPAGSCTLPVIGEDGLMSWDIVQRPQGSDTVALTHASFAHDALMFTDVPDGVLTLLGAKSGHGVRVDFPGFPYIGVWSAANDAPFVALEPWVRAPPPTTRTTCSSTKPA